MPILTHNTALQLQVNNTSLSMYSSAILSNILLSDDPYTLVISPVYHYHFPTRDADECGQVLRCAIQQPESQFNQKYPKGGGNGVCRPGSSFIITGLSSTKPDNFPNRRHKLNSPISPAQSHPCLIANFISRLLVYLLSCSHMVDWLCNLFDSVSTNSCTRTRKFLQL